MNKSVGDAREASRSPRARAAAKGMLAIGISFAALLVSFAAALSFGEAELDRDTVLHVRLPRVLLGAVAGAGLSAVGVALQALLRNPLAEPYVLGVSGGSALGATLVILFGVTSFTFIGASLVPIAALAGGLVATAVVYALAGNGGRATATNLLLSGVIVNAIASAAITFIKTLVTAATAQEMLFWLMGFLEVPSTPALLFVSLYVALGVAILLSDAGRLNLLALGPDAAENLGLDVRALSRRTLLACSLIVGAIVSVSGLIGFVGLIVPHAVRRLAGPDVRVVLPASILGGGATLVACDLLGRASFHFLHTQPPVGAVTALIGGPLFLVVLRKSRAMAG
jgi:iron complex transport system permease protein